MRKFDLKRKLDNLTIAWSITIEQAKDILDDLHEDAYVLTLARKTNAEYEFPEWFRTYDYAYDLKQGDRISYANIVEYEEHHYGGMYEQPVR